MSVSYTWVGWNRQKRVYDAVLAAGIGLYLFVFVAVGLVLTPKPAQVSPVILFIRAIGTCAFVILTIILCIGPLARLDKRFLPLLYNRRHLGVTMFLLGLTHAVLGVVWYHGFGNENPLISLLTANTNYFSFTRFPFEVLGLAALVILFLMAATSHDFWLKNLTPRVWKTLHMGVYFAYALLVMHIALGALQSERSSIYPVLTFLGAATVGGLHLAAGRCETARDRPVPPLEDGWIDVCAVSEIPEKRARNVCVRGADGSPKERIAVFKHDGKVSAVSNVCEHQGGPLGEGKIIDGCITCPWHGYQYLPENGQSPPPFTEKIHTYRVTVRASRVYVDPTPLPKGTPVEAALIEPPTGEREAPHA
jgi:nitrite reductase/ring-hydroxylating ferredoxin subunit/DMSO/TMAO reductase YedYZ heme-binding membrane subunit